MKKGPGAERKRTQLYIAYDASFTSCGEEVGKRFCATLAAVKTIYPAMQKLVSKVRRVNQQCHENRCVRSQTAVP
eukprot:2150766-Prorocentrum_lima.AAC.1